MSKRVLITGGGKRIGAALVKAFADEGFAVVIHANKSAAEAEELRQQLYPLPKQLDFRMSAQGKR